jgi:hypothetical protein
MELSILIPSVRPKRFREFIKSVVQNTEGVDYELVVDQRRGVLYEIINDMFERASGEYVVLICDDCFVTPDWAKNMLAFMRKQPPMTIGSFGLMIEGKRAKSIVYYDKLCAIIPCVKRDEIKERLGCLIEPQFKRFYGDPDLSLRWWSIGGQVKECDKALVNMYRWRDTIKSNDVRSYFDADERVFKGKWDSYDFNLRCYKEPPAGVPQAL